MKAITTTSNNGNNAGNIYKNKDGSISIKFTNEEIRMRAESEDKKKIVIIDDEPKIRILFTSILRKEGYDTIGFGDNAHAIQYLKESTNRIDILILDIDMPNIEGRYFCEMIRMKHPTARILIASNYATVIQKYLIFNADGYFDKSEGIKALKETIKKILSITEYKF